MKREIRFDKVDFEVTASIKKGRLVASLVAEVEATPGNVGRLLNFKKQSTALNLVIEAPQLALDLEFTEVRDPEAEKDDAIEGLPLALKEFTGWKTEGDKPVFKAKIDDVTGEGRTPREAVVAALVMGCILSEEEAAATADEIVAYLREHYESVQADGLFPYLPAICEVILEDNFEVKDAVKLDEHPVGEESKTRRERPKKTPAPV